MSFGFVIRQASSVIKIAHRCSSSVVPVVVGGIKDRMLKLITDNSSLCDTVTGDLNVPVKSKLSQLQKELLWEVSQAEPAIDHGKIKPSSKEDPNLVSCSDIRSVQMCHCSPHDRYVNYLVLYRNLPTRCFCGNWFLLVDEQRYEEEREKKWNKIKSEPENADLLKRFNDLEKELNILLSEGKSLTPSSPCANEITKNMAVKWKEIKNVYTNIRKSMLLD
ncbi:hypothetical protein KSF78_0003314 [Schistosoma japonicum]|uniref:SJCHGC06267 protein n=1 Tax=Schistosoma japonicum TaxID=6182 RepID=Q5DFC5_SCHJA|nr:SJCHGC06267 protein [Schistosoma japonicum]KAH8866022.1 hypothetical protein KSF78_0003314 [Schistosoma japonicum]KAH8866023.1 hypothetical protein KSF78_0003314 [Schistosoma japonicum]CAX71203.1 hypothetical protein [Schistosoma japonicum]CAX71205.1 hypothetical protein [Schistosoma japonicum]